MKFVRVTIDGVTYNLVQRPSGEWVATNRAPLTSGEYVVTITLTNENGQEFVLDSNDQELINAVKLLVEEGTTESGKRMLEYYPYVLKVLREIQAIVLAEGFEIDFIKGDMGILLQNAYLTTMDESRISEWENSLGVIPNSDDTIEDRRDRIIGTVRGNGKLNTAMISNIVNAFTGGKADSRLENGVLYVRIAPPAGNREYKFANVENAIKKKCPAHLSLSVTRWYATWGDIKNNFASWSSVAEMDDWESLNLYIAP